MDETFMLKELIEAVLSFDPEKTKETSARALKAGISPLDAIEKGLGKGLDIVGQKFAEGEFFLPELVMAAKVMKAGLVVIKPELERQRTGKSQAFRFVIGTVAGDIHDIGKQIVASMLYAANFEVHDLGVDVSASQFVEKVVELRPQFLGMSALITTTAPQQRYVIEELKKAGLRDKVKVIVGGAVTSAQWAGEIGADAWAANAMDAVAVAKALVKRER